MKNDENFETKIIKILSDEINNKIYCPYCSKFYKRSKMTIQNRHETKKRLVFNNDLFSHRDKAEWCYDKYVIIEQICPKGHVYPKESKYIDSYYKKFDL